MNVYLSSLVLLFCIWISVTFAEHSSDREMVTVTEFVEKNQLEQNQQTARSLSDRMRSVFRRN